MTARVVVVGAGVMGAWTALWLRRGGVDVALLDAYGAGNSLASSGDEHRITRSAHGTDELYPRWQRFALEQWADLERECGKELIHRCGVLWFAVGDGTYETASLSTLARLAIPAERLEPEELGRRYPQIGRNGVAWALHEPEGAALMARRGVAAVARAASRAGVEVGIGLVGAPTSKDGARGRLDRVRRAEGGEIGGDQFVFACGPWLPTLFPELLAPLVRVTRQEVVYFAPPPGSSAFDASHMPAWIDLAAGMYGIPAVEGRGFKVGLDAAGQATDPERLERRLSDGAVAATRGYLERRFPALAGRPVAEGRVCQYETTPDAHFLIDRHPAWDNVWVVGGGSGHGFKHGPSIGAYVSALVVGDADAAAQLAPPDDRFRLGGRQGRPSDGPPHW